MDTKHIIRLESLLAHLYDLRLEVNGIARAADKNIRAPMSTDEHVLSRIINKIFETEQAVKNGIEVLKEDQ